MWHQTFIICSLLSIVIAAAIVAKPFFKEKTRPYFDSAPEDFNFDQSLSSLETLADLEIDYKMGKISKRDFDSMSLEYKRKYLNLVNSSDSESRP